MLTTKNLTCTLNFAKIDKLLHFALDNLLNNNVEIIIIEQDKTLDKLSNADYELQALLYKSVLPHVYSLIIRSNARDLTSIVFHESVHLRQYESGRLDINPITGDTKWENKNYDAKVPYMDRPWEKEAFKEQGNIFRMWRNCKCNEIDKYTPFL